MPVRRRVCMVMREHVGMVMVRLVCMSMGGYVCMSVSRNMYMGTFKNTHAHMPIHLRCCHVEHKGPSLDVRIHALVCRYS